MLDNLRDQASFTAEEEPPDPNAPKPSKPHKPSRGFDKVTGTTAAQRFILAVMLSIIICLLGVIFLMISGKMVLPNNILDFLNQFY
jgi:hypothetical protein